MKKQFILPCLLLLSFTLLPIKACGGYSGDYSEYSSDYKYDELKEVPHEWDGHTPTDEEISEWVNNNSNSEEFNEEDFQVPEVPSELLKIMELVGKINDVYVALIKDLEEYNNRNLEVVANKLGQSMDLFNEAILEEEELKELEDLDSEDFPTNCEDALRHGFKVFSKAISMLERRQCTVRTTRRCIPVEISEKYVPQLKELYKELETVVFADKDEDGSLDLCKYWDENLNWEDEEPPVHNMEDHPNPEDFKNLENLQ